MSLLPTSSQAVGLFVVTNIDDIVVLALFFAQARSRCGRLGVVLGQYLGFGAILAATTVGAFAAGFLPESFLPYLGLLPIVIGVRAGWREWRRRRVESGDVGARSSADRGDVERNAVEPTSVAVAGVTFANGGDNIGVYVPVFASISATESVVFLVVFLVLVAVWCGAGYLVATRALVADFLSRWGNIVYPVVLIALGIVILIGGLAFGS